MPFHMPRGSRVQVMRVSSRARHTDLRRKLLAGAGAALLALPSPAYAVDFPYTGGAGQASTTGSINTVDLSNVTITNTASQWTDNGANNELTITMAGGLVNGSGTISRLLGNNLTVNNTTASTNRAGIAVTIGQGHNGSGQTPVGFNLTGTNTIRYNSVESTVGLGAALYATQTNTAGANSTNSAIDSSGGTTAFTGNYGIYFNQLGGSAGITTSATDTFTAITGSTGSALRMNISNYGNAFIVNRASTTNQFGAYGIDANNPVGFLLLHNSGALNGALGAINASTGTNVLRLGMAADLGSITGLTGAMTGGIIATTAGGENTIMTATGGTINTNTANGISSSVTAGAGITTITVGDTIGATLTPTSSGILASTTAGASGAVNVTANANVSGALFGIRVTNGGSGATNVTVGTGATVTGATNGIFTSGSGIATLAINGRVSGSIVTGAGNDAITLTSSGVATDGVVTGTIDGGTGTNTLTLAGTSTVVSQNIANLSNIGGITKSGTGTWSITGTAAVNPTYTVSAGTLKLGTGGTSGTLGSGTILVATAGTLAFDRSDTITVANNIINAIGGGQSGNIAQLGSGTTILTGTNTYSGNTTISAGTLQIGNGGTSGQVSGTITNNSALAINRSDNFTVGSSIAGTGTLTQLGADTLVLTFDNTYSGGTTISAGTLEIGAGTASGSLGTGNVVNNAALSYNRTGSFTIANVISGTGTLTKLNTGTMILTGTNTYSGTTTISAGSLQVGNGGTTGTLGTAAVTNNAALVFNRSDAVTIANAISGTGAVQHSGGGLLTLTGNNSFSGGFSMDAGSGGVQVGNGGTSGSLGTGTVSNARFLRFNRSDSLTVTNDISGTGSLTQSGTGTVILTGNNIYSGGTTINSGTTLQVGNGGATGSIGGGAVTNNGTLTYSRTGFFGLSSIMSGSGNLRSEGGGTLQLGRPHSYTGATSIASGSTLSLFDDGSIATSSGVANAGTFNVSGLTGAGTSIKSLTGAGTVTLGTKNLTITDASGNFTGSVTGTGLLTIGGGTFSANGTVAGMVTAGNGSTLKGTGTIGGLTGSSGGTVAPGNSIGTLNVAGNVTFAAGSIYQVEVDPAGASDRIAATGTATINGGTVDVQAAAGTYGTSTTYTILTATGGVTGTFTSATSNFIFLTPTLNYSASQVTLTLAQPVVVVPPVVVPPAVVPPVVVPPVVVPPAPAPLTFPSVALTPNQIASSTALQAGGAAGGDLFLAVLNSTSAVTARSAFDGASGEIHATLQAAQFENTTAARRTLLNRMRSADAAAQGWSLWGDVSGNWGHIDGDGNAARATNRGVAVTVGADTPVDANWRVGLSGGYSSSEVGVGQRRSSANTTGGQFAAYAFGKYDALLIRTGFAYGFGTANSRRDIGFALFNDALTAKQDVDSQQLFGEVGYGFALTGVTIEPFAGLSWTRINAGSFRETGGSAALSGNGSARDDGFSTLGAQLFTGGSDFAGGILTPSVRVGWQHAFTNRLATRSLTFVSSGQGFAVRGTPLDADRAVIDIDAALSLGAGTTLTLGYAGSISARAQDHGVRLMGAIGL